MTVEVLPEHHRVARFLCVAVEACLYPALDDWLGGPPPALRLRVGGGRATYCRADPGGHTITFGVRMVAEKCDPRLAGRWLTLREIGRRGYFGGLPTLGGLLAHTACHEFAHLVQQAAGWWRRGSVHNARFYGVLDELHASGRVAEVLHCLTRGLAGEPLPLHAPAVIHNPDEPRRDRFAVGDPVCFRGRDGTQRRGVIRRLNRVTATVVPAGAAATGRYYRVPFSMLAPDRARGAAQSPAGSPKTRK